MLNLWEWPWLVCLVAAVHFSFGILLGTLFVTEAEKKDQALKLLGKIEIFFTYFFLWEVVLATASLLRTPKRESKERLGDDESRGWGLTPWGRYWEGFDNSSHDT